MLEFNKLGGVGAIGVTANIAAKLCRILISK